MSVWIITYKERPITYGQVCQREKTTDRSDHEWESDEFFCAKDKPGVIQSFLYHFGFTWPEWEAAGYRVMRFMPIAGN